MASGSVVKRGSTWSYVIELARDPSTGKRRQQWKGGFRTKKEAEVAMRAASVASDEGRHVGASRKSVAAFLDEWVEAQRPNLRATTHASYVIAVGRINAAMGSAATPVAYAV